jgi:hypothetical protein
MNILSTALNAPQVLGNRRSSNDRGRPGHPWAIAALLLAGMMTGLGAGLGDRAIALEPAATSGSQASLLPSRFEFTPPPNAPRPASSTGTASRDGSPTRSRLIVPQDGQWGLTLSQRPTLLAYVADVDSSGTASFAMVREGTEEIICSARLENVTANRFLRLESCAELAVGQTYRWTLSLPKPTGDTATDRDTLVGFVKVANGAEFQGPGAEVTGINRVIQYGKVGVWYEAVAELATLWETSPNSRQVMSDWASVLAIAGLDLDPATLQSTPIATR